MRYFDINGWSFELYEHILNRHEQDSRLFCINKNIESNNWQAVVHCHWIVLFISSWLTVNMVRHFADVAKASLIHISCLIVKQELNEIQSKLFWIICLYVSISGFLLMCNALYVDFYFICMFYILIWNNYIFCLKIQ